MKPIWKTMETNQKLWNYLEKPCKPSKNHEKPWNHLEKPWKPTKNREKPWNQLETNLNPWKPIKTDMEPWKTNLEPSKGVGSWTGCLWGVQVVTGDSQEELMIFRNTNRHCIIIYILYHHHHDQGDPAWEDLGQPNQGLVGCREAEAQPGKGKEYWKRERKENIPGYYN